MNATESLRQIDALYAALPAIECKRLCQEACGPIAMSMLERRRIEEHFDGALAVNGEPTCPLLKDGRCTVYPIRPAICRLFGLVRAMQCPFGCIPERWISDDEAGSLLREVERLGRGIFLIPRGRK